VEKLATVLIFSAFSIFLPPEISGGRLLPQIFPRTFEQYEKQVIVC
jgi:hypothetical protein